MNQQHFGEGLDQAGKQIETILGEAQERSFEARAADVMARKPHLAILKMKSEVPTDDDVVEAMFRGGQSKRPSRAIVEERTGAEDAQAQGQVEGLLSTMPPHIAKMWRTKMGLPDPVQADPAMNSAFAPVAADPHFQAAGIKVMPNGTMLDATGKPLMGTGPQSLGDIYRFGAGANRGDDQGQAQFGQSGPPTVGQSYTDQMRQQTRGYEQSAPAPGFRVPDRTIGPLAGPPIPRPAPQPGQEGDPDYIAELQRAAWSLVNDANDMAQLRTDEIERIWEEYQKVASGIPLEPEKAALRAPNAFQMAASLLFGLFGGNAQQTAKMLAMPFQYAQQRQQTEQAELDAHWQNTVARATQRLRGLEGQADTATEVAKAEQSNVIKIRTEALNAIDRVASLQVSRANNQMTNQTRLDVTQIQQAGRMAVEDLKGIIARERDRFKSPEELAARMYDMLTTRFGVDRSTAYDMAWSPQMLTYYKSLLTDANIDLTEARTELTGAQTTRTAADTDRIKQQTAYWAVRTKQLPDELAIKQADSAARIERMRQQTAQGWDNIANDEQRLLIQSAAQLGGDQREIMKALTGHADDLRKKIADAEKEMADLIPGIASDDALRKTLQAQIDGWKKDIEETQKQYKESADTLEEIRKQLPGFQDADSDGGVTYEQGSFFERALRSIGLGGDAPSDDSFQWPTEVKRISSGFGNRTAPTAGASSYHQGIDIAVGSGTSVRSTSPGTVAFAGTMRGYGNTVIVQHSNGYFSLYGHLSTIGVKQGEAVAAGDFVARSGNSGTSTGAHLHFGMWKGTYPADMKSENAVDPRTLLPR